MISELGSTESDGRRNFGRFVVALGLCGGVEVVRVRVKNSVEEYRSRARLRLGHGRLPEKLYSWPSLLLRLVVGREGGGGGGLTARIGRCGDGGEGREACKEGRDRQQGSLTKGA